MIKVLSKQQKGFIQYAILIFLLLSLLTLFFTSFLHIKLDEAKKSEVLSREKNLVLAEDTIISNRIHRISGDLMFVADCLRLSDNGDGTSSDVQKHLIAFSNRKAIYNQIRFIDTDGNEIIRVN